MKYPNNKYSQERYEQKKALVTKLNELQSVYRFEFIEDPTNDSRESIALTGIVPISVNFRDSWNGKDDEYHFYIDTYGANILPYVRYETQKQIAEKYKKPNDIHKLNGNKIINWVEYLIPIYEEMLVLSRERVKKVAEFEESIKKLNGHIGNKDVYGQFSGEVIKNGIEFEFTVHDEAYISKQIKIHYSVKDTLESFLQLADNKYIKE